MNEKQNPLYKKILTDLAGIGCLILVPIIGPLPGPGGIPLTISGLGLLAVNHKWAQNMLDYVKKHSDSLSNVLFPDITWTKWAWDSIVVLLVATGTVVQLYSENWLIKAISLGIFASSTTIFMLNRNRITWLDNQVSNLRNKK